MTLQSSPTSPDDDSHAFAIVGSYGSARSAHEAGLSVLACGHSYWVKHDTGRYLLVVPSKHAEKLRREVEIGEARNRYWPPASLDLPTRSTSKVPSIVALFKLVSIFALQSSSLPLSERGANSSHAVLEAGEWWRLFTAITLHADIGHLAGNLLGLSLFGYLACRYLGNGLAWALIVSSAALSNLTNVLLNAGQDYRSLGASTAVFAALGLLAGFPIGAFLRSRQPLQSRDWLIPFFGGCVLFAWMGGGEFPTDVPAHLWSFAFGLAAACLVALASLHAKLSALGQRILLVATASVLGFSWTLALNS